MNTRADLMDRRAATSTPRLLERHALAGVSFLVAARPPRVEADVEIGDDTVIAQGVTLHGGTRIGVGLRDRAAHHAHAAAARRRRVGAPTRTSWSAEVQRRRDGSARSPTCARARIVREGAKIGTFVEVKNSDIGAGAKVPHLSYLGDADVGEQANIGASNVTANYDGRHKHRTKIGKRVKTGVDTTFVAPVSVGDDAYTGAGSVDHR